MDISYEHLRSIILEALKTPDINSTGSLESRVIELAIQQNLLDYSTQMGSVSQPRRLPKLQMLWLEDIVWDLIIEGILRPGTPNNNTSSRGYPFLRLTEHGKAIVKDQHPQPYDPDGYLRRVQNIPNIDSVIITYLEESIKTFRIHCLRASIVTLGCASEKAILLLIEAVIDFHGESSGVNNLIKATKANSIKRKHDELSKVLENSLSAKLPRDLKEDLEKYVGGLFSVIRTHRNEAGHPTGEVLEREEIYAYLVLFPKYLEKIYTLINWLKENRA